MTGASDDDIPVLVGFGEILDRPVDVADSLEPLTMMALAARGAEADAGAALLRAVDSLDVVSIASWRYADAPAQLAAMLGIAPARTALDAVGGESPVRMVHEAALRIARGESRVALVCGAEAQHSVGRARKPGVDLPWTPFAKDGPKITSGAELVHPLAARHGLSAPTTVYPLYEVASAAAWGQANGEALAASGEIWSRYSEVAAENPNAWLRRRFTADEITSPGAGNRPVAWPYTKLMVANPMVNQGAAVIVTSLAYARASGIPTEKMVFLIGGAAANEPRDFMARDQFARSHAQDAVLESARTLAPDGFAALELYSCFPCVPKMALRSLDLAEDVSPTVTGGLTFFGAPLSNYMLHAVAAMMRRVRASGGPGLLYGQGEFVTKHHALVVGGDPVRPAEGYSVQALADARRGEVPDTVEPAAGPATIESATILYGRDGDVTQGVAVLRTEAGARTIAAIDAEDTASLAVFADPDGSPVALAGRIEIAGERAVWTLA